VTFTQSSSVERYHLAVDTSMFRDPFGDGSGLELLTFDSTLSSINHGALSVVEGSVSFVDGRFGKAVYTPLGVKLGGLDDFAFTGSKVDPCALSCWINAHSIPDHDDNVNDNRVFLSFSNDNWGTIIIYINIDYGKFVVESSGSGVLVNVPISDIATIGKWLHVVINWRPDVDKIDVYIDGALYDSFDTDKDRYSYGGSGITIGGNCCGDNNHDMDCATDQVRFFDRALTQEEVLRLNSEKSPKGNICQSASVEAYRLSNLLQSAQVVEYSAVGFSQSQEVSEYTVSAISQSQNIHSYIEETFTQSESVATRYHSRLFQQMQRIHEYRPYVDKHDECDMFEGSPTAYRFASFEDTLDSDCYDGTLTAHGDGALFADGGKWGRAFRLDGNRWLSDTVTLSDTWTVALWFDISRPSIDDRQVVLSYAALGLSVYFSGDQFHIEATDIDYFTHADMLYDRAVQLIITVENERMRVFVDDDEVIDGVFGKKGTLTGDLVIGAYDVDGTDAVRDGRVDQLRIFDTHLSGSQLIALFFDSVAGVPFRQSSQVDNYMVRIIGQSSSVSEYTVDRFRQSNYLFGKTASVFKQSQQVSVGWKGVSRLRQSSLVDVPDTVVVIRGF